MIIIGSTAIKHWFPDFPREPKDLDYAVLDSKNYKKLPGVEFLENPILFRYGSSGHYLRPSILLTLKASHLCWNINWNKHMWDLQWLLKRTNVNIDEKLFWELYNYWNEYHSKNKRSDLKMSKDEFFTNAINYDTAQHDDLHKLINPIPTYTKVLKDGCEVELDENKFYSLTHEEKCDFVREEVYIMAYERYKSLGYREAYSIMLKKFIISHAPKFSIIFILKNYIELHKAKINFIKQIENGLKTN